MDNMLQCPYDENHIIRSSRMEMHLLKCERNHNSNAIEICPFNAKHVLKRAELRHHIVACPDKVRIGFEKKLNAEFNDLNASQAASASSSAQNLSNLKMPAVFSKFGDDDEDWDEEIKRVPIIQPINKNQMDVNESYFLMSQKKRKELRENMVRIQKDRNLKEN